MHLLLLALLTSALLLRTALRLLPRSLVVVVVVAGVLLGACKGVLGDAPQGPLFLADEALVERGLHLGTVHPLPYHHQELPAVSHLGVIPMLVLQPRSLRRHPQLAEPALASLRWQRRDPSLHAVERPVRPGAAESRHRGVADCGVEPDEALGAHHAQLPQEPLRAQQLVEAPGVQRPGTLPAEAGDAVLLGLWHVPALELLKPPRTLHGLLEAEPTGADDLVHVDLAELAL
mmetsp:Transcript_14241/g.44477  ORF Transcript_14241/g.44477 Transcript_14241/m.44477 type:complete len:232 (+) Transcript_14241:59-754(+)